jgi:hypothetical protein
MAKYYIRCGSLEIIYSTNKCPRDAAIDAMWEINDYDTLDEYIYLDERSYKGYATADGLTYVLQTSHILKDSGWTLE